MFPPLSDTAGQVSHSGLREKNHPDLLLKGFNCTVGGGSAQGEGAGPD